MKLRFSFLYEMSPEETVAKTQALEKIALDAITLLGDIAKREFNQNIERMRYSNMEAERRDKRWDIRDEASRFGAGFGKTGYKTSDTTTDSANDPHDNGEPFEADGTRYGYSNPSDPDEQ